MKKQTALRILPLLAALVLGLGLVGIGVGPAEAALCQSTGSGAWESSGTWTNSADRLA